jgi:SnoaL-like domain
MRHRGRSASGGATRSAPPVLPIALAALVWADHDERTNDMPDTKELLHSNLHEVFSERDPERRRAAIERTYTEDVTFIDPEGEFVGRQALSDQAQKLLDGVLAGFVLEEDGPRYIGTDTAALAWRFGPPGNPVARGIDILTIRDGRVSVVRTLVAPEADA